MKILYDLSASQPGINEGLFHGGGEYAKTVFYKLCEMLPQKIILEVFYNPKKTIDESVLTIINEKGLGVNFCSSNTDISNLLLNNNYDVFYSALPYSYYNLSIPNKTKFIYTIHGLRSLEYPIDKYKLKYKKRSLKEKIKFILFLFNPSFIKNIISNRDISRLNKLFNLTNNQTIVTVSNHSKYVLSYFFPSLDVSKFRVLYSPLKFQEPINCNEEQILKTYSLDPKKYILLVGGNRSEKGAYRACRVLYNLINKNIRIPNDIKIIVIGVSLFKSYKKLTKNNHRFVFFGYIPSIDLEILYKNAQVFLYPTLNEGFGYPPLEAMRYETICACSANSAVTEVCADSVLYFNPHDETEMSVRILQSFDKDIRKIKKENLIERYKQIKARQENDLNLLVREILS